MLSWNLLNTFKLVFPDWPWFFFRPVGLDSLQDLSRGPAFLQGAVKPIRLHFASVRPHQLSISLYLEVVTRIYFFPLIEKRKDKKKKRERQLVPIELVLGARFLTQKSLLHSLSITQEKAAPLGFTWLRQLVSADAAFKPMSDSMPQALPSSAEKHHPH